MILTPQQASRFSRLYKSLLVYANETMQFIENLDLINEEEIDIFSLPDSIEDLWYSSEIIDRFVEENPYSLSQDDISEIRDWRYGFIGRFIIAKYTDEHVLLAATDDTFGFKMVRNDIREQLPAPPTLVYGGIVPFEEVLVATMLIDISDEYVDEDDFYSVLDQLAEDIENGTVITSRSEIKDAAHQYEDNLYGNLFQNLLDATDPSRFKR
ncbi:MAG: hypothetical protein FWD45_04070, partial [Coriobacteriia bacterium]|nr:hypothetical protein [Coriobacteriia bacterium]